MARAAPEGRQVLEVDFVRVLQSAACDEFLKESERPQAVSLSSFRGGLVCIVVGHDRARDFAGVATATAALHQFSTSRLCTGTKPERGVFKFPKFSHCPGPVAGVHALPDPLTAHLPGRAF